MTAEQERRDGKTIKALEIELHDAWDEIAKLRKDKNHRIMCLESEIRARSAAAEVLKREIDILEEGLREAKGKIAQFRQMPETVPEGPGE